MKIILDTNVLISGIFFDGNPGKILEQWRDGKLELILSEEIFKEYKDVCNRLHYKFPGIDIDEILELVFLNARFYQPIKVKRQLRSIQMMINL